MLPAQRQDRIMAEIERSGGARIVRLAELLGVSDMTVRRDIEVLAARGLVRPGATIAVGAGTTTYAAAVCLARVPDLTVVTNSVRVADYLFAEGEPSQTVLLTGGLRTPSDALVGPIAVGTVSGLHVDCLLMGVHGMDPVAGFTTPNLMEAEMNRAMVASAGRLVVLADHTKWGVVGLCAMAALADASILVSDSGLTPEAREVLESTTGELIIADEDDTGSSLKITSQ
jgi:DeoR/GlpR family transcriptional regulator of sugar metabolism